MTDAVFRDHPPTYSHGPAQSKLLDYCTLHDQEFLSRVNTLTIQNPAGVGAGVGAGVHCICI